MFKTLHLLTFFSALAVSHIQGASIGSAKKLWHPGDQSREDWLRCRGMPCKVWERSMRKLRDMRTFEQKMGMHIDDRNIALLDEETSDRAPCVLYTEPEIDQLMNKLKHQTSAGQPSKDQPSNGKPSKNQSGKDQSSEDKPNPGNSTPNKKRFKRGAFENFANSWFSKQWPNASMPYKFDGSHNEQDKVTIRDAFKQWEDNTCVRFQEHDISDTMQDTYVVLTKQGAGCSSYVGKISVWQTQQMSLAASCLWEIGIPVHEIGHALGLNHEQQRFDRDRYINVNFNHINSYHSQFYLRDNTLTFGFPYDFGSVMHYKSSDGASREKLSMTAHDDRFTRSLGQRTGLSFFDAMTINMAYCRDVCKTPLARPCENSGYQDPNDCTRCRCPHGMGGTYCEKSAPAVNSICGGEITVGSDAVHIQTPGYDSPRHYSDNQECNWLFKARQGYKLELEFVGEFALYCHYSVSCYHWVEVRTAANKGLPSPRYCCFDRPSGKFTSENGEMLVHFRSNHPITWNAARRGFKARIVSVPDVRNSQTTIQASTTGSTTSPTTTKTTTTSTTSTTTTPTPSSTTTTATTTTSTTTKPSSTTTTSTTTPTTPPPSTTTTPSVGGTVEWSCGFEQDEEGGMCAITQSREDQFDWTRRSGGTPSNPTGPDGAHSGDYYLYIETSNPRRANDAAVINLPKFGVSGDVCVNFWVHMFGFHINEVQLTRQSPSSSRQIVWNHKKEVGNFWFQVKEQVHLDTQDQLAFVGIRGNEYSGDIAIDDISVKSGNC